jgi:hypothetical protein
LPSHKKSNLPLSELQENGLITGSNVYSTSQVSKLENVNAVAKAAVQNIKVGDPKDADTVGNDAPRTKRRLKLIDN